jgi:hypothetical protein
VDVIPHWIAWKQPAILQEPLRLRLRDRSLFFQKGLGFVCGCSKH